MLLKKVNLREIQGFEKVCMDFHFKKGGSSLTTKEVLIFSKRDQIFELNFMTLELKTTYVYRNALEYQPQFFCVNNEQNVMISASRLNIIYVDMSKQG